ncbi:hypothetical protein F2Q69_00031683 [Brassica cretica]|uniref:Uncharacterized protein n=1 Tax=Brassica cretica TaxID=69181 RepID=A0A8S9RS38_BRACR|nr:hypothetical protein F2Q69_00031683 [Brassica cretica]
MPSTTAKPEDDRRQSLNQKSGKTIESLTTNDNPLMEIDGAPLMINELKRELWSNNQSDGIETTDLQIKLNSKILDLHEKLKRCKTDRSNAEPEPFALYQRKTQDLRTRLNSLRAERTARPEEEHQEQFQRLNVIMGGSPPLATILSDL